MLTEKELQHVANLARIKLNKDEAKKFPKELGSILDFINQLNKVDTSKVDPAHQITGLINSFRTDEYRKDFLPAEASAKEGEMNEDLNDKLVGQAPSRQNRFIKVKSVLRKS
ncbi:MAG: Asp-tRNA(Asn)/Glu-tRNA(Gln) amidotransferase subunit GatC [Candidatus Yanofskybacteria bacterium]|nr:Asp-tRNA(Asn)/Glu-tRNA(Gln) amidotransferase subunit GatC [Candidatus Yanofskybacteria bacterium]